MDLTRELAEHAVRSGYDDLSDATVRITKMSILDTLGTMIAGYNSSGCPALRDLVVRWGGAAESTLFFTRHKLPAQHAALANSVIARALDLDDAADKGMHLSSALVPTALAMAERQGGINGRDLIATVAVGTDLALRINAGVQDYQGFDPTLTCGIFGTTVVAGRLLGLDIEQMQNALGLAVNECSGTFQSNIDGSLAVRLNQGLTAAEGILAAEFAQCGFTGVKQVFRGQWGFPHLYSHDNFDFTAVTRGLGQDFYNSRLLFKLYPSCGCTLRATAAALQLAAEKQWEEGEIETVKVRVGEKTYKLVGHPYQIGEYPEVNGQFSLQYTVASALLRRSSELNCFTAKAACEPVIASLVQRIGVELVPELGMAAEVIIKTKSGDTVAQSVDRLKGSSEDPLTWGEIITKFNDNIRYGQRSYPQLGYLQANGLVEQVANWEELQDITTLIAMLMPVDK